MALATIFRSTPPAGGLDVSLSVEGANTVVALRGEADNATLPILVGALARAVVDHDGDVVVDLAGTEFINTAALRAILRARGVLAGGGRQLTLRAPSGIATRLLGIFELGHLVAPAPEPAT